jgi:hypothetical protein
VRVATTEINWSPNEGDMPSIQQWHAASRYFLPVQARNLMQIVSNQYVTFLIYFLWFLFYAISLCRSFATPWTLNVPHGILGHVASLLTASSAMEILKGF